MVRSLGSTLVSAGTTFALVAAISWGTSKYLPVTLPFVQVMFLYTMKCVGAPQRGVLISIRAAVRVWRVKRVLNLHAKDYQPAHGSVAAAKDDQPEHSSVAIMAICPLYLQVTEAKGEHEKSLDRVMSETHRSAHFHRYSHEDLRDDWCPLEMTCHLEAEENEAADSSSTAQGRHEDLRDDWCPLEMITCHLEAEENEAADSSSTAQGNLQMISPLVQSAATSHDTYCVQVQSLSDRVALLLILGKVLPKYKHFRYVRQRNRFQAVVTTLQVGGYMLSLAERLIQGLDISAVEAIVAFLCLLGALHLLIELYACSTYERPLLLHLQPHQVSLLRNDIQENKHRFQEVTPTFFIGASLLIFLLSLPLIYFVYHYWHVSFISALAVLMFVLASMASSVLFIRSKILFKRPGLCRWDYPVHVPLIKGKLPFGRDSHMARFRIERRVVPLSEFCSGVMCGCGMALAIVATIVDWHSFEKPPVDWFAWISPHASTS